jgi:hypothetical protein
MFKYIILSFVLFLTGCSSNHENFKASESFEKISLKDPDIGMYEIEDDVYIKGLQLYVGKDKSGNDTYQTIFIYCDEKGNAFSDKKVILRK